MATGKDHLKDVKAGTELGKAVEAGANAKMQAEVNHIGDLISKNDVKNAVEKLDGIKEKTKSNLPGQGVRSAEGLQELTYKKMSKDVLHPLNEHLKTQKDDLHMVGTHTDKASGKQYLVFADNNVKSDAHKVYMQDNDGFHRVTIDKKKTGEARFTSIGTDVEKKENKPITDFKELKSIKEGGPIVAKPQDGKSPYSGIASTASRVSWQAGDTHLGNTQTPTSFEITEFKNGQPSKTTYSLTDRIEKIYSADGKQYKIETNDKDNHLTCSRLNSNGATIESKTYDNTKGTVITQDSNKQLRSVETPTGGVFWSKGISECIVLGSPSILTNTLTIGEPGASTPLKLVQDKDIYKFNGKDYQVNMDEQKITYSELNPADKGGGINRITTITADGGCTANFPGQDITLVWDTAISSFVDKNDHTPCTIDSNGNVQKKKAKS